VKEPEQQAFRYAQDLARLYAQVESDQERLRRVCELSFRLANCASSEELCGSLCASREDLGFPASALYLLQRGRLELACRRPHDQPFPTRLPALELPAEVEQGVSECADETWRGLFGGTVTLGALRGRRGLRGLWVGLGRLPRLQVVGSVAPYLELLLRHAGLLLEDRESEERRTERLLRSEASSGLREAFVGDCPRVREVLATVEKLAGVDSTVLLRGETGTGKTLLARALHDVSPRAEGAFVSLNCGAIPAELVESELFGHEAGAFTGAQQARRGMVELAEGGTLFLDEIGEMSAEVQVKLLSFLEQRSYRRVGGEELRQADVRVVSATNRDLLADVESGRFREDLLYRLNVFSVDLPPLRARGEDVVALAEQISGKIAARYDLPQPRLGERFRHALLGYDWPGNVRELRNVLERAIVLSEGEELSASLLPRPDSGPEGRQGEQVRAPERAPAQVTFDPAVRFTEAKRAVISSWEASYVEELLQHTEGNVTAAARLARMDKSNLRKKVARHGIDLEAIRSSRGG